MSETSPPKDLEQLRKEWKDQRTIIAALRQESDQKTELITRLNLSCLRLQQENIQIGAAAHKTVLAAVVRAGGSIRFPELWAKSLLRTHKVERADICDAQGQKVRCLSSREKTPEEVKEFDDEIARIEALRKGAQDGPGEAPAEEGIQLPAPKAATSEGEEASRGPAGDGSDPDATVHGDADPAGDGGVQ